MIIMISRMRLQRGGRGRVPRYQATGHVWIVVYVRPRVRKIDIGRRQSACIKASCEPNRSGSRLSVRDALGGGVAGIAVMGESCERPAVGREETNSARAESGVG